MSNVRNAALVGGKGTGKTSLIEAILFNTKVTKRLGRVEDGNTVSDYDPEEIARGMSLLPTVCSFKYNKNKIHMIDTAGYSDFLNETKLVLSIVDNAVLVLDGMDGVKSQDIKLWQTMNDFSMPRMIFVNAMEKELANFDTLWDSMREMLEGSLMPITVPVAAGGKIEGVVDLVKMKFMACKDDGSGSFEQQDIPDNAKDIAENFREKLVETIVEIDDALMEKYLEEGEVSEDEIQKGLMTGAASGQLVPVFAGSATLNVGVKQFLDYFLTLSAAPESRPEIKGKDKNDSEVTRKPSANESFAATVFKTTVDQYAGKANIFKVISGGIKLDMNIEIGEKERKARATGLSMVCGKTQTPIESAETGDIACVTKVDELSTRDTISDPAASFVMDKLELPQAVISLAIEPKERGEEDKLSRGLSSILEEDPLLETRRDEQTKQLTVCGTGQVHLDSVVNRLKKRFAVEVVTSTPDIPYRETITKEAKYVEYVHKKQTGGAGQYARVFIDMEPTERDEGYEFVDKIFGGVIDQTLRPSVDKGVRQVMAMGILAGYPVTDVRVSLVDGKTHPVDSKDMAFQIAGREVFKKAFMMCNPVLLEPVMQTEIEIPDECMGDVIGDINSRRGRVISTDQVASGTIIKANLPLAEMLRYAPDLDSMTSGRGTYTMELDHYEEVPKRVADEIVERYHKKKAEQE